MWRGGACLPSSRRMCCDGFVTTHLGPDDPATLRSVAEQLAGEAADLIYHLLVLLHVRNMVFQDVLDVLASRAEAGKGPKTRA